MGGRAWLTLAVLAALAGCAGPAGNQGGSYVSARHGHYPPPGPPEDPWGPYIRQAAQRFGVPEQWVRAVMRQESAGREDALSSAGAMGLMQVIPSTYATLRASYGLGNDPYEPHDNIMAGTAYIREMYDRYGAPGFLAAYNAGPNRLDSYLADGTPLPDETVGYLSAIAPRLGNSGLSGPLAVFAGGATQAPYAPPVMLARASSGTCDPDAAFDPDRPCAPMPSTPPQAQIATAYDRPAARSVLPPLVLEAPPQPRPGVQLASLRPVPASGSWSIQVGAFLDPGAARAAAVGARRAAPDLLSTAVIDAPPTTPFGGAVLYRARLASLTPDVAAQACARLAATGSACMTVPPGR